MAICFNQLSSRRLFKHFKPTRTTNVRHQIVLFNVLNDEFEADLIGSVPAQPPRSHFL